MSKASQKIEVNDLVKTSPNDVKVIVAKDGTVQVVGINETNVKDGNPPLETLAEITSHKRVSGVQQRPETIVASDSNEVETDVDVSNDVVTSATVTDTTPVKDVDVVETPATDTDDTTEKTAKKTTTRKTKSSKVGDVEETDK